MSNYGYLKNAQMFVNVLLESLLMCVKLIEMVLVDGLGLGQPENVERDSIVGAEVTVEQVGLHPEDEQTFIYYFFRQLYFKKSY
jgi:hypothetical protein